MQNTTSVVRVTEISTKKGIQHLADYFIRDGIAHAFVKHGNGFVLLREVLPDDPPEIIIDFKSDKWDGKLTVKKKRWW